jgi:hypothetical protein
MLLHKCLSCALASLIIVVGVTMLVMAPRKDVGMGAAFCLVVGILRLCDAVRGLRDDQ